MNKSQIKNYKDLKVWQLAIEVVEDIYQMTREFPQQELYGLTGQMRRSAISIPSNIAEGFKRHHKKEYVQFLNIAQGSTGELETLLIIANKLNYINDETLKIILDKVDHIGKMLCNLMLRLK